MRMWPAPWFAQPDPIVHVSQLGHDSASSSRYSATDALKDRAAWMIRSEQPSRTTSSVSAIAISVASLPKTSSPVSEISSRREGGHLPGLRRPGRGPERGAGLPMRKLLGARRGVVDGPPPSQESSDDNPVDGSDGHRRARPLLDGSGDRALCYSVTYPIRHGVASSSLRCTSKTPGRHRNDWTRRRRTG